MRTIEDLDALVKDADIQVLRIVIESTFDIIELDLIKQSLQHAGHFDLVRVWDMQYQAAVIKETLKELND